MALITALRPVTEASKHICCFCRTEYISRNEFFCHLNDGYMTDMPPTALIVANVAAAVLLPKAASLSVLEEPKSLATVSVLIEGFT